jgi:hypothetical protein
MQASYCKSCFRDLPDDAAACPRCPSPRTAADTATVLLAIVALLALGMGMLTLNARLCIGGAVTGAVAVAWHVGRMV